MRKNIKYFISMILFLGITFSIFNNHAPANQRPSQKISETEDYIEELSDIKDKLKKEPTDNERDIVELNNNIPNFSADDLIKAPFESYSELDNLGRCGACMAMIDKSIMPKEQRGYIGNIKPSGWVQKKYKTESTHSDSVYLYNRCHLIAYCLTGENDNPKNLITGTRQMNLNMLKYEDLVCDYIKRTNDKVLYRVTPIFEGDNLLCSGVQIEAKSVNSNEISFNVMIKNVEDNVNIDYKTGNSRGDVYE